MSMFAITFKTINVQFYIGLKIHYEFKLTAYNRQSYVMVYDAAVGEKWENNERFVLMHRSTAVQIRN